MGVEYKEFRFKIKNKRTKKIKKLEIQIPYEDSIVIENDKQRFETADDYQIIDFKIIYG